MAPLSSNDWIVDWIRWKWTQKAESNGAQLSVATTAGGKILENVFCHSRKILKGKKSTRSQDFFIFELEFKFSSVLKWFSSILPWQINCSSHSLHKNEMTWTWSADLKSAKTEMFFYKKFAVNWCMMWIINLAFATIPTHCQWRQYLIPKWLATMQQWCIN